MMAEVTENKKLTVYYAHSMEYYNTDIELKDIEMLKSKGYRVINPAKLDFNGNMWAYVDTVVRKSDIVYFRGFTIGVAQEVISALTFNKKCYSCETLKTISKDDKEMLGIVITLNNFYKKDMRNFEIRYPEHFKKYQKVLGVN